MASTQAPIWRIGVLVVMLLNIVIDILVSLNDTAVCEWIAGASDWVYVSCVAWVILWFACMCITFSWNEGVLLLSYAMFVAGTAAANCLRLAVAFDAERPPRVEDYDMTSSLEGGASYDITREQWCAIAGGIFDALVFVASWRPRGAQSTVKLPLNAAPTHVRPVLGEIIFNITLITILWGSVVIVRNDSVWDWCYMRDWMGSVFIQAYLCLYAACNGGVPHTWSGTQRLVAVFLWPVMGFMY